MCAAHTPLNLAAWRRRGPFIWTVAMGWFSKSEPRAQPLKEDIWVRCKKCSAHVFKEDWHNTLSVCPKC